MNHSSKTWNSFSNIYFSFPNNQWCLDSKSRDLKTKINLISAYHKLKMSQLGCSRYTGNVTYDEFRPDVVKVYQKRNLMAILDHSNPFRGARKRPSKIWNLQKWLKSEYTKRISLLKDITIQLWPRDPRTGEIVSASRPWKPAVGLTKISLEKWVWNLT